MRAIDLMILGGILYAIGHIEHVRDGQTWSVTVGHLGGLALSAGGIAWWVSTW